MTIWEAPDQTRRTFVKTVAYVAPAILTLTAAPALAHHGSQEPEEAELDPNRATLPLQPPVN